MQNKVKSSKLKIKSFLEDIIAQKREDLFAQKVQLDLHEFHIKKKITKENKFKKLFRMKKKMVLIGEVKFASPTYPNLGTKKELISRVEQYEKYGIDAVSIITERHFFKGESSFIGKVKQKIELPILQKDFVIDAVQIYEAQKGGADALLLIARLLNQETLSLFVDLCQTLGVEPVVEINNVDDLQKAVKTKTNIIAVNARDLETFDVHVEKACLLLQKIPDRFIKLGFSGIISNREVSLYKRAGAQGVLIGTSLMKTKNIEKFVSDIRHLQTKIKICGIRDFATAQIATKEGADFLGFNFVPTSKRRIDPKDAKAIIDELRSANHELRTKFVGVFQNQPSDEVNNIAKLLELDYVQLHGTEDVEYRKKITKPIIQKIHTDGSYTDRDKSDYFLLDREEQGRGKMVDIAIAQEIARYFPVFLAGGLTPDNVAHVVQEVVPFAVDVAGGIETEGKQDTKKMKKFIKNVKEVVI